MFKKILVANRGEIALRVICACKELGIKTVAIYSEADAHSLHVRFADEAVCVGPARASASYLNIAAVISAAAITNADAIHPGYGFLSEDTHFAEVCETSGITFIGPTPEMVRSMGDKNNARLKMKAMGVPVLPGSDGLVASEQEAAEWAAAIGYPVVLKAAAGGGGRGMRVANDPSEIGAAFQAAHREALHTFGSDELYLEKLIPNARHIEFQVLVDRHGNALHLGERECSIQRRYQKILEESPSTAISCERRRQIGSLVEKVLSRIGYTNAGTVEFLMDEKGDLYFIEMNTRIQVEHPVTEMVTGIDLVRSQILLAAGASLSEIARGELALRGHSIECRINAENPLTYAPSAGRITSYHVPGGTGVRVDSACYTECVVHPYYDSLLAKLVVHGQNRNEAINRMRRALDMFIVEGVQTLIPLHQRILLDPDFRQGNYNVRFLERYQFRPELVAK
ncbi:MAG: acetyl-CoA carboxylase biotin carboxylase subunit [Acidobacteria bacterium]|nr:acetyl-CoA carboxylase biotin carboxylase subunit [Acidobacteriota bacterium]